MKVFNLLRNTRPRFTHCISEFLYLGIFSPRNISSVIFHRTSTEKSIIFHRTESYNVFVLSSSSIFLSKNEVFMELKYISLYSQSKVLVALRSENFQRHSDSTCAFGYPFFSSFLFSSKEKNASEKEDWSHNCLHSKRGQSLIGESDNERRTND